MKKILLILLACVITTSVTSCSTSSKDNKSSSSEKTQITDAANRKVEKPSKIDRIAVTCYGGATHEIATLGASNKIVAQPSMDKFPQLKKIYPNFNNVLDPGSFDNVNVEELLKTDPDMVFVGVTSSKGNELIEKAGLSTFTMSIGSANIESLKKEFQMVGTLLDNEAKSKELLNYWDTKISMVNDLVSKVPEKDRKKVYYAGAAITKASSGVWGDALIKGCKGINVTSSLADGAKGKEVSVEQVFTWNPDIIITQKTKKGLKEFQNDNRIKDLDAIKNKKLYQCPSGAFWWDRPSPEAPLGFMWLATVLYPEYTKDIDLKKETKDFYKTFYNYNLSDEEYASFF